MRERIALMRRDETQGKYNTKLSFLIRISPGNLGSPVNLGRRLNKIPTATSTNPTTIMVFPKLSGIILRYLQYDLKNILQLFACLAPFD